MDNYIRACFCSEIDNSESYYLLLTGLNSSGCTISSEDSPYIYPYRKNDAEISRKPSNLALFLSRANFFSIKFDCSFSDKVYDGRLMQIESGKEKSIRFDIQDNIFLQKNKSEAYVNTNSLQFRQYIRIVTVLIKVLNPSFGQIDFDADWFCSGEVGKSNYMVGWGTYVSFSALNITLEQMLMFLNETTDFFVVINDTGVLFFINPLAANQAWTHRHETAQVFINDCLNGN